MSNPVQPVIVVKKKGGHAAHHGGAWKVAYADFVTAMMAFFLVMWLVGQSKAVKAGVGGYFRDPVGFSEGGRGVLPGGDTIEVPKPQAPPEDASEEAERHRLESAVGHIKESLEQIAGFQNLRDQVEFTVTPEGLRIDLIEKQDNSFFASGSATMHPETERILGVIAKELGALDHDVVVEGHTDSHRYSADRYSNWELSADRANAARRVMEREGLQEKQVTAVRGLADRQLRVPSDPFDARNRRVSILVKSPILKTGEHAEPAGGAAAPKPGEPAVSVGETAPKAGEVAPKVGEIAPKLGDIAPKLGDVAPKSGAMAAPTAEAAAKAVEAALNAPTHTR